jgi:20S proteasome subunit beta 2
MLATAGMTPPKALKTGTTICGVMFNGGIVLGADTRATEGEVSVSFSCLSCLRLNAVLADCG